jgi:hypothetical protein
MSMPMSMPMAKRLPVGLLLVMLGLAGCEPPTPFVHRSLQTSIPVPAPDCMAQAIAAAGGVLSRSEASPDEAWVHFSIGGFTGRMQATETDATGQLYAEFTAPRSFAIRREQDWESRREDQRIRSLAQDLLEGLVTTVALRCLPDAATAPAVQLPPSTTDR